MATVSPCLYFEFTSLDWSDGIAQVSPATVIDVAESAEIVPCAFACSSVFDEPWHDALLSSTAVPPAVPPPIFPPVNPLDGAKVADTLPRSRLCELLAWPRARPAMEPPL